MQLCTHNMIILALWSMETGASLGLASYRPNSSSVRDHAPKEYGMVIQWEI